jgi:hypothetical protein
MVQELSEKLPGGDPVFSHQPWISWRRNMVNEAARRKIRNPALYIENQGTIEKKRKK